MRKKIMPCFIVIVILASMFSGCIEEKTPESNYQKSAKGEWQPPNPDAFKRAEDISRNIEEQSKKHDDHTNQLVNDIVAQNAQVDIWIKEHDARINEIEKQSIRTSEHAERVGKKSNEISEQMQDYNFRMNGHIKKITRQNTDVCENIKVLQSHINEISAKSTKDAERMQDYNSRLDGHIKKIESQNACIDAWAKEHNDRMNALEGDIAAQNAEIYEASINAQEHINELNKLTNDCLSDLLHMYADIGMSLCGMPGSMLNVMTTTYEYNIPVIEKLGMVPGFVSKIIVGVNYLIVWGYDGFLNPEFPGYLVADEAMKIFKVVIENYQSIAEKNNKYTHDFLTSIEYHIPQMYILCEEYEEIASKSVEDSERMEDYNACMNELVAELTDQNICIVEDMQDYNAQTNGLIVEIIHMIEKVEA